MKVDGSIPLTEDARTGLGQWILATPNDLDAVLQLSEKAWIQSFHAGLRCILICEDLLSPNHAEQLAVLHQTAKALRHLIRISMPSFENQHPNSETLRVEILPSRLITEFKQHKTNQINSSRRNLFRTLLSPGQETLSRTLKEKQLTLKRDFLPHSPRIDSSSCTACDACAKVCPSQAIQIQKQVEDEFSPLPPSYVFTPENCDACGLCESVCQVNAITTPLFLEKAALQFQLLERVCLHCQHIFHLNPALDQLSVYCPSCRIQRHARGNLRIIDN